MKPQARLLMIVLSCCLFIGCRSELKKQPLLLQDYDRTVLKFSNSADALAAIGPDETEFLSQSESVLASWGRNKKRSMLWFNAVAFDEEQLTAARKYCFIANEKSKGFFIAPEQKLLFRARAVISPEVLDEPYPNQNARKIAILKNIITIFSEDMVQLTADSQTLQSAVLMSKQALNLILHQKLDSSPALAARLSDPDGLEYLHPTLGKASVQLSIDNDIADVNIRIGKAWLNRAPKPKQEVTTDL